LPRVNLSLIYNHRFEKNVDRLSEMYGSRFSEVNHLMPFGIRSDAVIPVWEASFQFHGFVAQAFETLSKSDAEWFLFAGDDLILAPDIDEENLVDEFNLAGCDGFIKGWRPLSEMSFGWYNFMAGLEPFLDESRGTEWRSQLPGSTTARRLSERHGFIDRPLGLRNVRRQDLAGYSRRSLLASTQLLLRNGLRFKIPYPLAAGYSDIFAVRADRLEEFARICGVMAAMRVHVETAIPTAMMLATSKLATEAGLRRPGLELWTQPKIEAVFRDHAGSIESLGAGVLRQHSWIHPVKLSKWT
jgi:hypothetical protein